jgi:DNA repair exonuclease SbcCD nuclease subunit
MAATSFRLLLLADTHIGLDCPVKPRVERRRRGDDFLSNFRLALQPALDGETDLVVHGGDLFDRAHIPDFWVQTALGLLVQVAESGVPVFLVPGNHERSHIPLQLWRQHPKLHIFDQPGTIALKKENTILAVSGFPYTRRIGMNFLSQLKATRFEQQPAQIRLLCMHQAVEGAKVGPQDYTFRPGPDVIRGAELPGGFCAILSGHIHQAQHLQVDQQGRKLASPVLYPGSVERTAFAEQNEEKGFITALLEAGESGGGRLRNVVFRRLPARLMLTVDFMPGRQTDGEIEANLRETLAALDPNAVVRIRLHGELSPQTWRIFSAQHLRAIAPASMNIEISHQN